MNKELAEEVARLLIGQDAAGLRMTGEMFARLFDMLIQKGVLTNDEVLQLLKQPSPTKYGGLTQDELFAVQPASDEDEAELAKEQAWRLMLQGGQV